MHAKEQNLTCAGMSDGRALWALDAGIDDGCALIVDADIRDDELGVGDGYLELRGDGNGQTTGIAVAGRRLINRAFLFVGEERTYTS